MLTIHTIINHNMRLKLKVTINVFINKIGKSKQLGKPTYNPKPIIESIRMHLVYIYLAKLVIIHLVVALCTNALTYNLNYRMIIAN